jgi:hypothetical protein
MTDRPDEHDLMDAIKQWREREFGLDHLPPAQQKRRRQIVKQWIVRRGLAVATLREPIDPGLSQCRPTERELRDYCLAVASAPDLLASEDALMTYFLAREFLKLKPEAWPPQEIADLVDGLVDSGTDLTGARRKVADLLGRERRAIERKHQKLGRHKGQAGRPRKRNENPE